MELTTGVVILLAIILIFVVRYTTNPPDWIKARVDVWISTRADEAKERTRKLKLENDKLELELEAMKRSKSQSSASSSPPY